MWLKEYSDYFKQMYSIEIPIGEKNITKTDFDYYNQQQLANISSKSMTNIVNLKLEMEE